MYEYCNNSKRMPQNRIEDRIPTIVKYPKKDRKNCIKSSVNFIFGCSFFKTVEFRIQNILMSVNRDQLFMTWSCFTFPSQVYLFTSSVMVYR